MFRRKVLDEMIAWKASPLSKGKAMVVKGLRQVGKTFIVKEYASRMYDNVVYLDFRERPDLKAVFEGDLDVSRLVMNISASIPDARFVPRKTILIFDEVQECSRARMSIKQFMADGRFDVICTGSLLGLKGYNRKVGGGVPVGSEHTITMKPMDFEEFLWAKGVSDEVISHVKDCFAREKPVDAPVHTAMFRHFREYICVGGLPSVVQAFLATNDMNAVRTEQLDIISGYRDDFGKHLDDRESEVTDEVLLARINRVFDSVTAQLAKENKKFQYSLVEKGGRSSAYQEAIQWLIDYGLLAQCNNLSLLQLPLEGNRADGVFKLYFQDSGLMVAMLESGSAKDILFGDLGIYNGAVYEDIVADAFSKMGRGLFYYRRDSGMEIDFVIRYGGKITIIEVKSKSGKTKSADTVLSNPEIYGVDSCIKLGKGNVGRMGGKLTIPYYMAFLLKEDRSGQKRFQTYPCLYTMFAINQARAYTRACGMQRYGPHRPVPSP